MKKSNILRTTGSIIVSVVLAFGITLVSSCTYGTAKTPTTTTSTSTATSSVTTSKVSTTPSITIASTSTSLPQLNVYFIDVGQGDAILIDQGTTEVLIDGGDKTVDLVPFLRNYVDGPLEVVVTTHPHADHIGGLPGVFSAFTVLDVWDNGETATTVAYSNYVAAITSSEGAVRHVARQDMTFTTGQMSFYIVSPFSTTDTTNNNSVVLSLKYGTVDFLFMGDAEKEAEGRLVASSNYRVLDAIKNIEILKVGHHGSRTASSPKFLSVASAEVAVYSAGTGNTYGHPHPETIANLTAAGAKIYGTDVNGTITVKTDGHSYSVISSKAEPINQVIPTSIANQTVFITATRTHHNPRVSGIDRFSTAYTTLGDFSLSFSHYVKYLKLIICTGSWEG